ncbi:MAG: chromosomal replication initiator DnaA [Paracoccaceae bacterium]
MTRQLSFDLPVRPALGREDFFVSQANSVAVAVIESWRSWAGGKLVLIGPRGAGKTHLAHVWAGLSGATLLPAAALPGADIPALARAPVAVEDADRIAGDPAAEAALFHLHNLALAEGAALLLTGQSPPTRWGVALPDLASRLQATQVARLDPPDDALLSALLAKLFADRQLWPSPETIAYLTRRIERSFDAAQQVVADLDRAALAEQRPVSRALASKVLDAR